MIAVRVAGPMKIAVVGAPTYFAGRRPPRTPDDLASHSCIQYRLGAKGPVFKWQFERKAKSPPACPRRPIDGEHPRPRHSRRARRHRACVPSRGSGRAVCAHRPTGARVGGRLGGGGKSVSILSRTPAGPDRIASVHRHGARPEIDHRRRVDQESVLTLARTLAAVTLGGRTAAGAASWAVAFLSQNWLKRLQSFDLGQEAWEHGGENCDCRL